MRAPEALVGLAALLVLTAGVDAVRRTPGAPAPPPASPAAVPALAASPGAPIRVDVPALGLTRELVPLDVGADGALEVPADPDDVGRWTGTGPVVLAGHVDSVDGPAVFHGLRTLAPGDEVLLGTSAGVVRHVVERVERYAKDAFPTFAVFTGSGLRLVTCGGRFDRGERSYDDNVVVWAVPV